MQPLELLLTAVALAMDAFAVAVATGVCLRCLSTRQIFRMSWHFGLFQALMPIIGWFLGNTVRDFVQAWAHWIAFALLAWIGSKMIREAMGEKNEDTVCDPTCGAPLVMLSIATSIDALAVGLSLSLLGISVWWPAAVIGLTALGFTALGMILGERVAKAGRLAHAAEILGGLVLIGIGLKILAEHDAIPLPF